MIYLKFISPCEAMIAATDMESANAQYSNYMLDVDESLLDMIELELCCIEVEELSRNEFLEEIQNNCKGKVKRKTVMNTIEMFENVVAKKMEEAAQLIAI